MKLMTRGAAIVAVVLLACISYAQEEGRFDQQECLTALESNSEYRRQVAAEFLAKLGDSEAVAPLVRHMHNDSSVKVRKICLMGLLARGKEHDDKTLVSEFIKLLDADDTNLRQKAVFALGELRTGEGYNALLPMLEDSAPEVRVEAINALARFNKKETLAEFAGLLTDEDRSVRRTAVRAIAEGGGSKELVLALENDDPSVVQTALEGLGRLKTKDAVDLIIPILYHENASLRVAAAKALRLIGGPAATAALIRLLTDENPEVRRIAVEGSGPNTGADTVEQLISLLDDRDAAVREAAIDALVEMKVSSDSFKKKLRYLAAHDPYTTIREKAGMALKILEEVRQWEDQEKKVRQDFEKTWQSFVAEFKGVRGLNVDLLLLSSQVKEFLSLDVSAVPYIAEKLRSYDKNRRVIPRTMAVVALALLMDKPLDDLDEPMARISRQYGSFQGETWLKWWDEEGKKLYEKRIAELKEKDKIRKTCGYKDT